MNWGAKQEEGGLVFLASGTRTRAGTDGPAAVHVAALVRARALQNHILVFSHPPDFEKVEIQKTNMIYLGPYFAASAFCAAYAERRVV